MRGELGGEVGRRARRGSFFYFFLVFPFFFFFSVFFPPPSSPVLGEPQGRARLRKCPAGWGPARSPPALGGGSDGLGGPPPPAQTLWGGGGGDDKGEWKGGKRGGRPVINHPQNAAGKGPSG